MIFPKAVRPAALSLTLALAACTPIASVKMTSPTYCPVHGASEVTAAQRCLKNDPPRALGDYVEAARVSAAALKAHPKDETARLDYNYAVARAVEALSACSGSAQEGVLTVPSTGGDFHVTAKIPASINGRLKDYRLYAADSIVIGGTYFKDRPVVQGVGAPFAAIGRNENKDFRKTYGWKNDFGTATAIIRFSGPQQRNAEVEFIQPLLVENVTLDGRSYPLAGDFSAPMAILMAEQHPEKLGLRRLLTPGKYTDTARLMRLQAYDPDRIPVLFVHGLQDTPASWAPMINSLRADKEVRDHYQFWVFSYPSGYPYPYSASLLRDELDGVQKAFPNHKPIVLVGHSMGGMISRLLITDAGDKIWRDYFGKPPAETHFVGHSRQLLEKSMVFNSRQDLGRVIFISAPHRGSNLASMWLGRLAAKLVRAPAFLADIRDSVFSIATLDPAALKLDRMPNSIDTLAPNNRFVLEINTIPISKRVPYHSIIGDRGKGDTPNSSDGVVPYWSSHLDGAQSEKIVPSNHGAPRNPVAIEEVKRILKLHLKGA